jgi:hypothetical protein
MRAADPSATYDHVFDEDKGLPPEEQTVFTISQLTAQERAYLLNIRDAIGTLTLYALHLGLVGVRNFPDKNGQPLKFERDMSAAVIIGKKRPWKAENLDALRHDVMDGLANLILKGIEEGVKGAEAKNS